MALPRYLGTDTPTEVGNRVADQAEEIVDSFAGRIRLPRLKDDGQAGWQGSNVN
jgi:hypothetical protein